MSQADPMATPQSPRAIASWRFWVPLVAQVMLIMAVPVQAIYTQITGRTLILQVSPTEPYNLLQSYYLFFSYDISDPATLQHLPGWQELAIASPPFEREIPPSLFERGTELFVVLEQSPSEASSRPVSWVPIRVSRDRPTALPSDQIALRGLYQTNQAIVYGVERYYIPEDAQAQILNQIDQLQSAPDPPAMVVEVKVNRVGQAVPISFWIQEQRYRF